MRSINQEQILFQGYENMYWIMQQGDELSIMINYIFPRKGVLNA